MSEKCRCGHAKIDHIYEEGACRSGVVSCYCKEFILLDESSSSDKLPPDAIQHVMMMTLGWAHADSCIDLDKGRDPRKKNIPEMAERAKKDLLDDMIKDFGSAPVNEICICAAVKTECGKIIRGHRHGDCIHNAYQRTPPLKVIEQGFVTSLNRFVTREEGWNIQNKAKILSADKDGYRGNKLFSEDLY